MLVNEKGRILNESEKLKNRKCSENDIGVSMLRDGGERQTAQIDNHSEWLYLRILNFIQSLEKISGPGNSASENWKILQLILTTEGNQDDYPVKPFTFPQGALFPNLALLRIPQSNNAKL